MAFWKKIGQQLGDLVDDLAAPDEVREQLRLGVAALDAGRLDDAERAFRKLMTMDPDHARARHLLGLSLMGQNRLDEAVECLEQATEARSRDIAVLADLAEARWQNEDHDAALATFREALRCGGGKEELARIFRGMGEIYLQRGAHEHALRELRKAVALAGGEDAELLGLLGQAQYRTGKMPDLARQSLQRAAAAPAPSREVLLLLCEVLLEQGEHQEAALGPVRLLEADEADVEARCALARCLLAGGDRDRARQELLRALQDRPRLPRIHRLLGEVHAASADPVGALNHLQSALALLEQGEQVGADLTSARNEREELLEQMLRLELELDPSPEEMAAHARALLELRPANGLGLACLGVATADRPAEALDLLSRSLAAGESHAARLGLGLVFLADGRPAEAAVALRAAARLEPQSARAGASLQRAYQDLAGLPANLMDGAEIYPLLRRIHALLDSHPALTTLGPEVARIQEIFDRPLLITVMGEFNSGKSTLVNALIGEKIAPMGITPTTATINILKYGEKRQARVIWRDDTEQLLGWSEVGAFLDGLNDRQARAIRHVELMYPAEELLRVNVVDTPGLNSLVDEHEQTAREILGRADAVIWLFSAQQAGKQTEQEALEVLAQHRLKTVGVLNKIDRLTPEDLDAVLAHLSEGFAELVDAVIPVSARQALDAMTSAERGARNAEQRDVQTMTSAERGTRNAEQRDAQTTRDRHEQEADSGLGRDEAGKPQSSAKQPFRVPSELEFAASGESVDAAVKIQRAGFVTASRAEFRDQLEASRFPELRGFLEERLFARSRQIKRQASRQRLDGILASARQRISEMLDQAEGGRGRLDELRLEVAAHLDPALLDREREALQGSVEEVYRQGAGEVLEFVRPRQWRLGQHKASAADRDFLLDLLLDGLSREVSDASLARMSSLLKGLGELLQDGLEAALASEALAPLSPRRAALAQLVQERAALLRQQVYTRYLAFARGYLCGGRVDHFFTQKLPRLELSEETVFQSLAADSVDLEAELLGPLHLFLLEAAGAVNHQLADLRGEVELTCLELDRRLLGPLLALEKAVSR